jgi:cobalt-zinc-cadmium resistance protein CzcA
VEFDALGKSPLLEIVPKREAMSKYNLHAAELNAPSTPRWPGRKSAS